MAHRLPNDKAHQDFAHFVSALFQQRSMRAIEHALRQVEAPVGYQIHSKVVYAPTDALRSLHAEERASTLVRHGESGASFELRLRMGRRSSGRIVRVHFAALPTGDPRVRALTTVASAEQWDALRKFLRSCYPRLVPTYLAQSEILDGVRQLRDSQAAQYDLRVKQLVATEEIRTADYRRKPTRSIREWTDEAFNEAVANLRDNSRTLKSIRVGLFKRIGTAVAVAPTVVASISRRGEIGISGDFALARRHVVTHFAAVGVARLEKFSKRSLRDTDYHARPIELYFDHPALAEVSEVRRLVATLERYPASNYSVPHGNPFARVTVLDRYDGSSFDVWAVTGHSVVLMPKIRASEAALGRLVHYLSSEFMEGDVRDYVVP